MLYEVISVGYRIVYDSKEGKYEISRDQSARRMVLLGFAVGLVLMLILSFWEAEADYIREALIPGDNRVTRASFQTLTERLRQGEALSAAVSAFCEDILHGAIPAN